MSNFTVRLTPDIIHGDVSKVIQSNKTDLPFASGDILFDWQPFLVPTGTNKLVSISGYMMGEDGETQGAKDIHFVFAKNIDGSRPSSLGEENAPQTACFELPLHYIGYTKVEGNASPTVGAAFGDFFSAGFQGGANGHSLPLVLEGETDSGTAFGFDTLHVAAFAGGAIDFSTGVLKDGAVSVNTSTDMTVKTVDARHCFQKGDTLYIHDSNVELGTVSSVPDATSILLEANNGVAISDGDEIVNANPLKIVFGFERM
tara:strand:+ start:43 stop:816 length:774 start_codon:yes stop_codon:yes gene_type:complete